MKSKLEQKVKFLTRYVIFSTAACLVLLLSSYNAAIKKDSFDEIDVKRINILSEKGDIRMVISNKTRQHSGRMDGEDFPQRERSAGLIFFNEEGDECGGLIHGGKKEGNNAYSGMSFTMDQYKNDQVIQIINNESYKNGKPSVYRGFIVNDIPYGKNLRQNIKLYDKIMAIKDEKIRKKKLEDYIKNELGKNRLFLGKNRKNENGLFLRDQDGKFKMKIFIDSVGNPQIQTFDTEGNAKNILLNK